MYMYVHSPLTNRVHFTTCWWGCSTWTSNPAWWQCILINAHHVDSNWCTPSYLVFPIGSVRDRWCHQQSLYTPVHNNTCTYNQLAGTYISNWLQICHFNCAACKELDLRISALFPETRCPHKKDKLYSTQRTVCMCSCIHTWQHSYIVLVYCCKCTLMCNVW